MSQCHVLEQQTELMDNAVQLAKQLGTSLREIRIQDAVMQHFKDISHDPAVQDVTYENGQARERTQILMDIANQVCGMVIGTGDMSELALGWATYNGDHMSMYGVNCSVPKTLVRYLVQFFADTCENDILKKFSTMCWIRRSVRSCFLQKRAKSHRKQRILWDLMNFTTFSCIIH